MVFIDRLACSVCGRGWVVSIAWHQLDSNHQHQNMHFFGHNCWPALVEELPWDVSHWKRNYEGYPLLDQKSWNPSFWIWQHHAHCTVMAIVALQRRFLRDHNCQLAQREGGHCQEIWPMKKKLGGVTSDCSESDLSMQKLKEHGKRVTCYRRGLPSL